MPLYVWLSFEPFELLLEHYHNIFSSCIGEIVAATFMSVEWKHHKDKATLISVGAIEDSIDYAADFVHDSSILKFNWGIT
jgi:hypothetical protein